VGHILPFSNHWACDESKRHVADVTARSSTKVCFLYHNTTLVQQPIDHSNLTRTLAADATGFIARRAADGRPFFYYLAFPQCHVSMFTGTDWSNTSANGIFGDQIREMDWAVGQVLDALSAHSLAANTLLFFSSDHGPHVELCLEGGYAGGLRGGKGDSSWEGGLRGKQRLPICTQLHSACTCCRSVRF
jgi:arylsulfatase A-like enzyme